MGIIHRLTRLEKAMNLKVRGIIVVSTKEEAEERAVLERENYLGGLTILIAAPISKPLNSGRGDR